MYAFDRRGYGERWDGPTYAIQREIEDIAAVVDASGKSAHLLGHSFGALCALDAGLLTRNLRRPILYEPAMPLSGVQLYPEGIIDRLQAPLDAGDREALMTTFYREVGGRFILGLGAGWHEEEYQAYGYEFPSARVCVEQLEEAIQIIGRMWREETATFAGRHYRVAQARCEPRPDPIPPIMVGAFKPKMLRLTAKYADWWNVSSTSLARYRPMVDTFEGYCAEVGRAPSAIRRTWIGGCACAPTQEEAVDLAEDRWSADDDEDFGFVGTPDRLLEQMMPFVDLGIDTFIFDCGGFPKPTTLHMLISEVLPRLAGLKAQ